MAKKIVVVETKSVTFEFGEAGSVVFDLSKVSDEMLTQLALHGASQKGGDSYAGAKAATDGTDIDPNEWAKSECQRVIDQIYAGEWSVRRAGSGPGITDLARALAEVMPDVTEADAAERLADATREDKAALRKHPAIKAVLERLRAERAAAKAEAAEAAAGDAEVPSIDDILG